MHGENCPVRRLVVISLDIRTFAQVVNFGRGPDGTEFVLRAFPFGGYAPRIRLPVLLFRSFVANCWHLPAKVRFEDAKTVKLKDGRMVRFLVVVA